MSETVSAEGGCDAPCRCTHFHCENRQFSLRNFRKPAARIDAQTSSSETGHRGPFSWGDLPMATFTTSLANTSEFTNFVNATDVDFFDIFDVEFTMRTFAEGTRSTGDSPDETTSHRTGSVV